MPYYEVPNILFIHIPKTGGTVIENEIKKIYKETLFSPNKKFLNNILDKPYNSITPQHQFYTTIYKYKDILNVNFNNIKIFSVVRNPYDKIISDLFWLKMIDKNTTSKKVYIIIKYLYINRNDLGNHNQPQYKFITDENLNLIPNINIFYCEKLNDTNDELNKFLGFNINIKQENVNKNYSKFLNRKSIALINTIYKKDFKLFNYKMLKLKKY
tara:strand:- start:516 stop:1154 length:639 start_codon:yes stop_codon:yes gene_type:complete